jgi:hypothetical protein
MSRDERESVPNNQVVDPEWLSIRDALRGLRYGSVNIIVQDGVIVQIDRTEKKRIRKASSQSEVGTVQ